MLPNLTFEFTGRSFTFDFFDEDPNETREFSVSGSGVPFSVIRDLHDSLLKAPDLKYFSFNISGSSRFEEDVSCTSEK